MASQFPKLPGYYTTHDPTITNHKKVSHVKLDQVRNAKNTDVSLYTVPKPAVGTYKEPKNAQSMSLSHTQFTHAAGDIQEQFEPVYVKLDKQVRTTTKEARAASQLSPRFLCQRRNSYRPAAELATLISNLFIIGLEIPRLLQGKCC